MATEDDMLNESCLELFNTFKHLQTSSKAHILAQMQKVLTETYVFNDQTETYVFDAQTLTRIEEPSSSKRSIRGRPKGAPNKLGDKQSHKSTSSSKRDRAGYEGKGRQRRKLNGASTSKLECQLSSCGLDSGSEILPVKSCRISKVVEAEQVNGAKGVPIAQFAHRDLIPLDNIQSIIESVTDVEADGNCGFRAVAVGLERPEKEWKSIRLEMATYTHSNRSICQNHKFMRNVCETTDLATLRSHLATCKSPTTPLFWMDIV